MDCRTIESECDMTNIDNPHTDDLLDCAGTCRLLGGIHRVTLYRAIQAGRIPRPIHVTPGTSRWRRSELLAAIDRAASTRDGEAA
jgi:predicted DNA-binding transcriptional regulator AlpA